MTARRRIAVLTTGRQDFGILRSTCHAIAASPALELALLVGGMHLDARYGRTVEQLEAEGLPIAGVVPIAAGDAASEAAAMMTGLARLLRELAPSALMLVGDRSETVAAGLAAQIERVPVIHLHGGEETEGAIDNAFRHALTKLSHLHLVSHPDHARRVLQMGEADDQVHVVGAPGLDNLHRRDLPSRDELAAFLGVALAPPVVIVTMHATTLGGTPRDEAMALVKALERIDATFVVTRPNNDAGGDAIASILESFVASRHGRATMQAALGEARYFALLNAADAMVGNSSSGLIEAPIARLPVVNVGDRQRGRLRGDNVIDVPADADAIAAGLRRALQPLFRAALATVSPYGDGHSAERIVEILTRWSPPSPPRKRFVDRRRG